MPQFEVRQLCEDTRSKLKEVCEKLEHFLNHSSLPQLLSRNTGATEEYYKGYLSDLRYLLVHCEVAYEKLGVALRRPKFNIDYSEKILYEVVHTCVYNFFYPRSEAYEEDGRRAYTGKDAIKFREEPASELMEVTISLSKIFEYLREELNYYETDYITQKRLEGEQVQ